MLWSLKKKTKNSLYNKKLDFLIIIVLIFRIHILPFFLFNLIALEIIWSFGFPHSSLFLYIAPDLARKEEPQTLQQSCDNMLDKITDYLNGELAGLLISNLYLSELIKKLSEMGIVLK